MKVTVNEKSEEFFNNFYRNNRTRHVNTIRRIVGCPSRAEDVVQQAYERAWKYRDKFNPNKSGYNQWFNKILFNSLRDTIKLRDDCDLYDEDSTPNDEEITSDLVREEIESVDNPEHQEVLRKVLIKGYKAKDLTNRNNVDKIIYRFKERISLKYVPDRI